MGGRGRDEDEVKKSEMKRGRGRDEHYGKKGMRERKG